MAFCIMYIQKCLLQKWFHFRQIIKVLFCNLNHIFPNLKWSEFQKMYSFRCIPRTCRIFYHVETFEKWKEALTSVIYKEAPTRFINCSNNKLTNRLLFNQKSCWVLKYIHGYIQVRDLFKKSKYEINRISSSHTVLDSRKKNF